MLNFLFFCDFVRSLSDKKQVRGLETSSLRINQISDIFMPPGYQNFRGIFFSPTRPAEQSRSLSHFRRVYEGIKADGPNQGEGLETKKCVSCQGSILVCLNANTRNVGSIRVVKVNSNRKSYCLEIDISRVSCNTLL